MGKKIAIAFFFASGFIHTVAQNIDRDNLTDGIYANINTTKGNITLQLFYQQCPMTVANFVGLAEGKLPNAEKEMGTPYFDGLTFHRVISKINGDENDFMIQSGDPEESGMGGPGYFFKDEFVEGLTHEKGTLSMANTGKPGTNGSQFFITLIPTPKLDNKHTIFGKVYQGQNVADSITQGTIISKIEIIRVGEDAKKFDAVQTFQTLSGINYSPHKSNQSRSKKRND